MGKKKRKQKTDTREAFGVTVLKNNHARIRGLKQDHEPDIHGHKFWNSSYLIMDFLKHQGLPKKARVMEVGCGWGLASIYCAKKHDSEVIGVDADPKVFPYLHVHAEINDVGIKTQTARFEDMKKKQLADRQIIVGADICFWDSMIDPLYKLVRKAVKAGVEQVVIADPGRSPFDGMCEKAKKKLGGEVKEWEVTKPVKAHGWLLIVGSLPS